MDFGFIANSKGGEAAKGSDSVLGDGVALFSTPV
jgi:hypothetical protein